MQDRSTAVHYSERCEGPRKQCAGLLVLRIVLHNSVRKRETTILACSLCSAAILTVHGVHPEGAVSPFRVVDIELLNPPGKNASQSPQLELVATT